MKLYLRYAACAFMGFILIGSILYFPSKISSLNAQTIIDNRKPTIIVDAGHGGVDPGAIGPNNIYEKDINLSIAKKIRDVLSLFDVEVLMVRDEDISLHDKNADTIREKKNTDLKNRLKLANETQNCVYLSIHQNAFTDGKYSGTQVFYGLNNPQSMSLAQEIQSKIKRELQPFNNRQIVKANSSLYILNNAVCPCVLVECGFMSNENELNSLMNDEYQNKLSYLIALSLLQYI